jgi:hypothetical protein
VVRLKVVGWLVVARLGYDASGGLAISYVLFAWIESDWMDGWMNGWMDGWLHEEAKAMPHFISDYVQTHASSLHSMHRAFVRLFVCLFVCWVGDLLARFYKEVVCVYPPNKGDKTRPSSFQRKTDIFAPSISSIFPSMEALLRLARV